MNANKPYSRLIRVALADDDVQIQDIVETLLKRTRDINLIGSCPNGQKALTLCKELHPDILLLDILMPVMDGFEAASLIRERFPKVKILVLSSIHDNESIQAMMLKEIDGYINKSALVKDLAAVIRTIYQGEIVLSREAFRCLNKDLRESKVDALHLTEREKEVLPFLLKGMSISKTSEKLGISATTVKSHAEKIYRKCGVRTHLELMAFAANQKLF